MDPHHDSSSLACPYKHPKDTSLECPVNGSINPLNNMPNDLSSNTPTEAMSLDNQRTVSSIPRSIPNEESSKDPKDGTNWVYPSPRMFYTAMHRKGTAPPPSTIPSVLAIHNYLNERVWEEITGRWEKLHRDECVNPKLKRFAGMPGVESPRARMVRWWSGVKPFDRHDWIVDRCGREVRYVIDYYGVEDEGAAGDGKTSPGKGNISIKDDAAVFYVDIRPALDSFGALRDRIRVAWREWTNTDDE